MEEVRKTKSHTFKLRQPDGETGKAIIFCDADGYVSGISNIEGLVAWSKRGAALQKSEHHTPIVVTEEMKKNMRFFSEHTPCWFPGCESLREAHQNELQALEAEAPCSDCDKGALVRKYLKLVTLAQKR